MLSRWYVALVLVLALVACAPSPNLTPVPTQTESAFTLASSRAEQPVTPAVTPTPAIETGTLTVRVWWPDELYPSEGSEAEDLLLQQFEGFRTSYTAYDLVVRRKRADGLGGILPTLRTARTVAPGAMPDLTLMRYSDMVTAVTEGLIVPLNAIVPADLVDDNLLGPARALGEFGGQLYGVPYVLNFYHTAYRASLLDGPLLTFDEVLDAQPVYAFPAGSGVGSLVNWTVLTQYLAAGGRLVDETGAAVLDSDPLLTVLAYYEAGVAEGLFPATLLEATDVASYWPDFANAATNMLNLDAFTYLQNKDLVQNVGLAALPTAAGQPLTLLDGWVWVMTTQDPDHQNQALAFVSWMMRVNPQSLLTEAMGVLPSQRRALRLWDNETYVDFAQELIASGRVIPSAQRGGPAAAALQAGFAAVLQGSPAEQAAESALAQLPFE